MRMLDADDQDLAPNVQVMDKHMAILSKTHLETKFVKVS